MHLTTVDGEIENIYGCNCCENCRAIQLYPHIIEREREREQDTLVRKTFLDDILTLTPLHDPRLTLVLSDPSMNAVISLHQPRQRNDSTTSVTPTIRNGLLRPNFSVHRSDSAPTTGCIISPRDAKSKMAFEFSILSNDPSLSNDKLLLAHTREWTCQPDQGHKRL